jgi:hypothetical protein
LPASALTRCFDNGPLTPLRRLTRSAALRLRRSSSVCAFHQAVALMDAWSIIEATPKMVDAFNGDLAALGAMPYRIQQG